MGMNHNSEYFSRVASDFYRNQVPWRQLIGDQAPTHSYNSFSVCSTGWAMTMDQTEWRSQHTRQPAGIPPERIRINVITGQGTLMPHRDHGPKCTLNWYIRADAKDTTKFWQPRDEQVRALRAPGAVTSNVYLEKDLDLQTQFTADTGQAWLLNTDQIHSVQKLSREPRILLSYQWMNYTYQQVLATIQYLQP